MSVHCLLPCHWELLRRAWLSVPAVLTRAEQSRVEGSPPLPCWQFSSCSLGYRCASMPRLTMTSWVPARAPRSLSAELLCSQNAACGGSQSKLADADGHTGHSQETWWSLCGWQTHRGLSPLSPSTCESYPCYQGSMISQAGRT